MMKINKDNNVAPDSNFSTGAKALLVIIVCVVGISLLIAALPIIIPVIWIVIVIAGVLAILWGVIELLGCGINSIKKCKGGK